MLPLLEKTRMINKLLQNTETVSYKKMAEVLKDVIKANIYIVSSEGELLGYSILDGFECELMIKKVLDVGKFPADYVNCLKGYGRRLPTTVWWRTCALSAKGPNACLKANTPRWYPFSATVSVWVP